MRLFLLLTAFAFWTHSAAGQSYFSAEAAASKLQKHHVRLTELQLALLSKEAATRDYQAQWKRIFREAQELEGILACADSEWYYGRFEPQVYRTQSATFEEPEQFFNELTRLVALSSYTFESLAAAYESKGCSRDGVRAAVQAGRAAHERLRQPLKGIAEGDR